MIEETLPVAGAPPIRVWRLRGDGSGPDAHLQAGLHADEIPGMLVLHELLPRLLADEAAGRLRGDVTVVPQCNPIGLGQFERGRVMGRFDQTTGHNFNRAFPEAEHKSGAVFAWQAALLRLVADTPVVLDLHTDDEALPYVYLHAALWPAARDLAAWLGVAAAILWEGGGGGAFEDAVVARWLQAGRTEGRICATVELRGQADVDAATARADADALHAVLRGRGVIAGAAEPPPWDGEALPIGHVQTIRAPASGVLDFRHGLGQRVAAGAAFARLIPQPGMPQHDQALCVPNEGVMLTRLRDRYVQSGGVVAKFTGRVASPSWADVPLDD